MQRRHSHVARFSLSYDFVGSALAADVHVSPNRRFVCASVRSSNVIAALRVDPTSGGGFLICAGQRSGTVALNAIDAPCGALARRNGYDVGSNANWVEIVPAPDHP